MAALDAVNDVGELGRLDDAASGSTKAWQT